MAIGMVRKALEETPLLEGQGKAAIEAFRVAREANRQWMHKVERTPALKAMMDNVEPDKFMDKFVLGSGKDATVKSVAFLRGAIKDDPGAISVVKNYMARYLKDKATSGASDEMAKFSQSAYNKALKAIGDRKLRLFFKPDEMNMLKSIGRVASYEQNQPSGSAVNNSKTFAATAAGILDGLGNIQLLRKLPFGAQLVGDPAKSISQNIQASQVLNIPGATAQTVKQPRNVMPYLGAGLAAQNGRNNNGGN